MVTSSSETIEDIGRNENHNTNNTLNLSDVLPILATVKSTSTGTMETVEVTEDDEEEAEPTNAHATGETSESMSPNERIESEEEFLAENNIEIENDSASEQQTQLEAEAVILTSNNDDVQEKPEDIIKQDDDGAAKDLEQTEEVIEGVIEHALATKAEPILMDVAAHSTEEQGDAALSAEPQKSDVVDEIEKKGDALAVEEQNGVASDVTAEQGVETTEQEDHVACDATTEQSDAALATEEEHAVAPDVATAPAEPAHAAAEEHAAVVPDVTVVVDNEAVHAVEQENAGASDATTEQAEAAHAAEDEHAVVPDVTVGENEAAHAAEQEQAVAPNVTGEQQEVAVLTAAEEHAVALQAPDVTAEPEIVVHPAEEEHAVDATAEQEGGVLSAEGAQAAAFDATIMQRAALAAEGENAVASDDTAEPEGAAITAEGENAVASDDTAEPEGAAATVEGEHAVASDDTAEQGAALEEEHVVASNDIIEQEGAALLTEEGHAVSSDATAELEGAALVAEEEHALASDATAELEGAALVAEEEHAVSTYATAALEGTALVAEEEHVVASDAATEREGAAVVAEEEQFVESDATAEQEGAAPVAEEEHVVASDDTTEPERTAPVTEEQQGVDSDAVAEQEGTAVVTEDEQGQNEKIEQDTQEDVPVVGSDEPENDGGSARDIDPAVVTDDVHDTEKMEGVTEEVISRASDEKEHEENDVVSNNLEINKEQEATEDVTDQNPEDENGETKSKESSFLPTADEGVAEVLEEEEAVGESALPLPDKPEPVVLEADQQQDIPLDSPAEDEFLAKSGPEEPLSASSSAVSSEHAVMTSTEATLAPTRQAVSAPAPTTTSQLRIPSHATIKVIKGEIHNVLTVLRDQRYVSRSRFTEEIVYDEDDITTHPVVQALQELHVELTQVATDAADNNSTTDVLIDVDYLEPFCQAIERRDISASVTGTALASLHKFVLYGFVSPSSSSLAYKHNIKPLGAMMRIAEALLRCTFEESSVPQSSMHHLNNHPGGINSSQHGNENGGNMMGSVTAPMVAPSSDALSISNRRASFRSHAQLRYPSARMNTASTLAFADFSYDDEQTVLKLLDVAALVVRTAMQEDAVHMMDSGTIVRLLDTCLHVSHRAESASPLLKSAASSALSQIVLQVFAGPGLPPVMEARRDILEKLSALLNPASSVAEQAAATVAAAKKSKPSADSSNSHNSNSGSVSNKSHHLIVTNALTLINIALETCREPLAMEEIRILQNDVCRYLLQWSHASHDLMLLSLTLRVIFNLFQSIRNHLKVPLEVFLTSIHMRIINDDACMRHSPEEREVALESLLEFCQEPALMQDIFLNYDCDVACSNLYEAIVAALGRAATPVGWEEPGDEFDREHDGAEVESHPLVPPQNKGLSNEKENASAQLSSVSERSTSRLHRKITPVGGLQAESTQPEFVAPVTHLQRLGMDGLLAILDSIEKRCQGMRRSAPENHTGSSESLMTEASLDESGHEGPAFMSHDDLHERKRRKHALVKIARVFNAAPSSDDWLKFAVKEGVLDSETSVEGVAEIMFTASHMDKAKVGIYLSKGPDTSYPFHAAVRQAFVAHYDFSELTFAAALRKFLSKFRLPGEAQCIDRFMEAFSKELYKQQGDSAFFENADTVYVLAFSTIMLNTDLHNPTIKEENRMTKEQFIRNNRGINAGKDLPEEFLAELYDQIKAKQIEVRKELGEFRKKDDNDDYHNVWDSMISKKGEVATPFFTEAGITRSMSRAAGFHDKEMFILLTKYAIQALAGIFQRSWDDSLVVRALVGLQTLVRVAAFLEHDATVNDVLQILLPMGCDYIMNVVITEANSRAAAHPNGVLEDGNVILQDDSHPIPYGMLCSNVNDEEIDITGSAVHRGLLALDSALVLVRKYTNRVEAAWPTYILCICALRDARALPEGMSDLDDFADSSGNILPLSTFAKMSQRRLDELYRSHSEKEAEKSRGWFRSLFRRRTAEIEVLPDDLDVIAHKGELSSTCKAFRAIAEAADVETVLQLGSSRASSSKRKMELLLDSLEAFPFRHDPIGEQHGIFSLELATRALLYNRERSMDLFPPFLMKFEHVLSNVSAEKVPAPFVIERIVVTVLRCCIHLYDVDELRPHLRTSLNLILISLPRSFIRVMADRMACGLAIILRNSYHLFESHNDWTLMSDTLDMLAHFRSSRVFVFDGIASTVEYALLSMDSLGEIDNLTPKEEEHPVLTKQACTALSKLLIRFVVGFYQGDMSLAIPAMMCLERVYRHYVDMLLEENGVTYSDATVLAPDCEVWQNIAVAFYTACRANDPELSVQGAKTFRRVIIRTSVEQIPDDKWLDCMFLMVNKQPPIVADESRGNTFSLLGQLIAHVVPHLSQNAEVREDLVDLMQHFAELAQENLRQGRRGSVSTMFEKTLQTVTYLSNLMVTSEWVGEAEFSAWASECLLAELERVGAAGATLQNQMATQQRQEIQLPASPESDRMIAQTNSTSPPGSPKIAPSPISSPPESPKTAPSPPSSPPESPKIASSPVSSPPGSPERAPSPVSISPENSPVAAPETSPLPAPLPDVPAMETSPSLESSVVIVPSAPDIPVLEPVATMETPAMEPRAPGPGRMPGGMVPGRGRAPAPGLRAPVGRGPGPRGPIPARGPIPMQPMPMQRAPVPGGRVPVQRAPIPGQRVPAPGRDGSPGQRAMVPGRAPAPGQRPSFSGPVPGSVPGPRPSFSGPVPAPMPGPRPSFSGPVPVPAPGQRPSFSGPIPGAPGRGPVLLPGRGPMPGQRMPMPGRPMVPGQRAAGPGPRAPGPGRPMMPGPGRGPPQPHRAPVNPTIANPSGSLPEAPRSGEMVPELHY